MSQRNMRFVLEEGNTLTLRDEKGVCVQVKDNLIPEGHSFLLFSEDLSYITYGPSGFHYKRYDPESLTVEEQYTVSVERNEFQGENDDIFPLAAYSPIDRKAFFFIISKSTRVLWVLEKDLKRQVQKELPSPYGRYAIHLKKEVEFESSYVGIGNEISTAFLFGTDSKGKWNFAVDIPKDRNEKPKFVRLGSSKLSYTVGRKIIGRPFLFGEGINPRFFSVGREGYVRFSQPDETEAMEEKSDSIVIYHIRFYLFWFFVLALVSITFSGLMTYISPFGQPQSFLASDFWCIEDCVPRPQFELHLVAFLSWFIFCMVLFGFAFSLPKFSKWIHWKFGITLYGNALRSKKPYFHTLERFENLQNQDFCLVSQHYFAFNQGNKIQIYDNDSRKVVGILQGAFNGFRLLKQNYQSNWVCAYNIADDFLQLKVCNFESNKVDLLKLQLTSQPSSHLSNPNIGSTTLHPQPTLRRVLIDYQEDAFEPFKPNKRVRIEHTTNPMRLIIQAPTNSGQIDFYTRLRHSPKIWSALKQISNLTDFVHDHDNENEVVFELDKEKTLVREDDFFDHISQRGEGTFTEDGRLRLRKGNKELAPSLETAIFLENDINHPVTVFLSNFSDNFPKLMKSLWVGDRNQEILQLVETFNIEDDLPAMSYIQAKRGEYEGASPKQNTEMWHDWQDYLPWTELDAVFEIIKEKELWPRNGHAHQMMHGDLRPANVVVNAGEIVEQQTDDPRMGPVYKFVFDLFLCDFPDIVAKSGDDEILYRTENVDGTKRITSHFFETEEAPKINPMLDLARFFAYMLIKIPFEPTAKDAVGLSKEKRNRRTQARNARQADFKDTVRRQLDRALTWSENNLRNTCFLAEEGTEDTWRELLKAMIFDQCLQVMMHWKRGRSGPAIEGDLGPEDLCWIFYNVSTPQPVYAPTFLDKARDIAASRKAPEKNDDNVVHLSAAENKAKLINELGELDVRWPKNRSVLSLLDKRLYTNWSSDLINAYDLSKLIEDDVMKHHRRSFDGPDGFQISRVGFTQSAWDVFQNEIDEILDQWVVEEFCDSRHLRYLEKSPRAPSSEQSNVAFYEHFLEYSGRMVLFAVYYHEDDTVLHLLGFYK